jgi:cyanate permease
MVSMIGLWAGSVYAPGAVTQVALRDGYSAADAARIASWATMLFATGTIIGCLCMPLLAPRIGRHGALTFYFALMTVAIASGFGYAFYLPHDALKVFLPCLFLVLLGHKMALDSLHRSWAYPEEV